MKKLFLLLASITLASCGGSDDGAPRDPISTLPVTTATTYIKGQQNGVAFDYSYTMNSLLSQYSYNYSNGYSGDGFTNFYYYGGMLYPINNFNKYMIIGFNNMFSGNESDESAAFYDSLATVPTNYLSDAQNDLHLKGVEINFQTSEDVYYSTLHGSQSGSTFVVTSSTQGIEPGGTLKTKTITGTFSCKLYQTMNVSNVINVTNGQFKIILREYN